MRVCERLVNGVWTQINFRTLRAGDTFRLTDDGKKVTHNGKSQWVASNNAYPNSKGIYTVDVEA